MVDLRRAGWGVIVAKAGVAVRRALYWRTRPARRLGRPLELIVAVCLAFAGPNVAIAVLPARQQQILASLTAIWLGLFTFRPSVTQFAAERCLLGRRGSRSERNVSITARQVKA